MPGEGWRERAQRLVGPACVRLDRSELHGIVPAGRRDLDRLTGGGLRRGRVALAQEIGQRRGERPGQRARVGQRGAQGAARLGALTPFGGQQRRVDSLRQRPGQPPGVIARVNRPRRRRLRVGDGGGVARESQRRQRPAERDLLRWREAQIAGDAGRIGGRDIGGERARRQIGMARLQQRRQQRLGGIDAPDQQDRRVWLGSEQRPVPVDHLRPGRANPPERIGQRERARHRAALRHASQNGGKAVGKEAVQRPLQQRRAVGLQPGVGVLGPDGRAQARERPGRRRRFSQPGQGGLQARRIMQRLPQRRAQPQPGQRFFQRGGFQALQQAERQRQIVQARAVAGAIGHDLADEQSVASSISF